MKPLRLVVASLMLIAACGDPHGRRGYGAGDAHLADGGPAGEDGSAVPDGSTSDGETCDDGLDDDADGTIDEGCYCLSGDTQPCFTGAASSRGVGACADGVQTCSDALEFGVWGPCEGESAPAAAEICDGETDENCDGAVDEGCGCDPSTGPIPCGLDEGACVAGTQECVDGMLGECVGGTGPGTERCNGADDDCDGTTDESLSRRCGTDEGECSRGTQTCLDGSWDACSGGTTPVVEACNSRDDDCDARTDESGACPTTPPVATCGAGVTAEVLSTVTVSGTGSDPDGGAVSYQWTVTTRPAGSTSMPATPTSPSTSFYLDASGTFVLRLCVTDDEGLVTCCNVTVTSTAPGVLHVELSWDEAYGDVDLHVLNTTRTPPAGWWTSDDCYYSNPTPDWPPAGASSNPTLDVDDTDGYGPENITIDTAPASGTYNVAVHYYCDDGSGRTDATVRVYCMGALIATYGGIRLNGTDDWVNVASVTWPGCVGMSIDTRTTGTAVGSGSRHCL